MFTFAGALRGHLCDSTAFLYNLSHAIGLCYSYGEDNDKQRNSKLNISSVRDRRARNDVMTPHVKLALFHSFILFCGVELYHSYRFDLPRLMLDSQRSVRKCVSKPGDSPPPATPPTTPTV